MAPAVINLSRNNTDNVNQRKFLFLRVLPLPLHRLRLHRRLVMGNIYVMVSQLKSVRNCQLQTVISNGVAAARGLRLDPTKDSCRMGKRVPGRKIEQ